MSAKSFLEDGIHCSPSFLLFFLASHSLLRPSLRLGANVIDVPFMAEHSLVISSLYLDQS